MGIDLAEAVLVMAVFLGAIVQGFSGFAFSAVAGAILLQVQAPGLAIPLLMICSLLIQGYVLMRMRAAISLSASIPYLAGGVGGVVLAAVLFDRIEPQAFRHYFGAFLMLYALSTVLRPQSALLAIKARPVSHTAVGFAGGLVGGLTAMPGAVLAIWCDAHAMPKTAQRAVVQPFIAAMQSLALAVLFLKAPAAPVAVLHHLPLALPALFAGVTLGLFLFNKVSDHGFRRAISALLFFSGIALVGG
ncbi:MAG: sulfite exporter TauE/SafE family protein [Reyranella sp.]|nr:sulfite exporter TauE/SafE family protein [Reyranella sp.]